jgi:hypothetical protein
MDDAALPDYEKLGAFYLGRAVSPEEDGPGGLVMYDSRDLTTHAVCVGMTGSGKTGLGISIIEEAAMDGVPVIAIDPKGDLGNLMLTFPELDAASFRPWIDPGAAERKGMTPDAFAASQAELWRNGLAEWGQGPERIARLREMAEFAVYTPGSSAGRGLTPIRSMDPPAKGTDPESARDRLVSLASGLCTLLGVDADPIQSREHILLASVIGEAWSKGVGLDLAGLIGLVQNPPLAKIGVLDVDAFMAPKDRGALAMRLNNLLASPGFAGWLDGEPMDIERLLHTPQGKPRVSVLSIAHLGDQERMFFVTLVLGELIAWMRRQPGTGSLRAMLYMDEVFGYFPPTANPPSKTPLLTLMKQARAYGVGCVLATQNPVDLDYKGLSNAGTWLIGRLQTERDKARLMDGLDAVGGGGDRGALDRMISGLGKREFLLHSVHGGGPTLFRTRWAMSYLRGPMTVGEIRKLANSKAIDEEKRDDAPVTNPTVVGAAASATSLAPAVPAGVSVTFAPVSAAVRVGDRLVYRPALLGEASLHHVRAGVGLDLWRDARVVAPIGEGADGRSPWDAARVVWGESIDLDDAPDGRGAFEPLHADATNEKSYAAWAKSLKDWLYRTQAVEIHQCKALKLTGEPGELLGAFRVRVRQAAHERRDAEVEELRAKYAKKVETVEKRVERAERAVERERGQAEQARLLSAVSIGQTILGVLLGRKKISSTNAGRAGTAARSVGRANQQAQDVDRAEAVLAEAREEVRLLADEANREIEALRQRWDPEALEIETVAVAPRKSEMRVGEVRVVWLPVRVSAEGRAEAAYRIG